MSILDEKTDAALGRIRSRLRPARVMALVGFAFASLALAYYELALGLVALGSSKSTFALAGLGYAVPFVADALFLVRINRARASAERGDVVGLRTQGKAAWPVAVLVVSILFPVLTLAPASPVFVGALDPTSWAIGALPSLGAVSAAIFLIARAPFKGLKPAEVIPSDSVLEVTHLTKYFSVRRTFMEALGGGKTGLVHAVDDVTFKIRKGEVFGLAGESGSGKTTVLRTALMLTPPTSGSVVFKGMDIRRMDRNELKKYRTKIQVVFQDPYESVNPRMTVFDIVAEGLMVNNLVSSREEAMEKVTRALREVQITPPEDYLNRYPHELSGGQRQRVAIARALVLDPEVILADEPVSMLDVSIRAEVINVLLAVREKRGISVLMVTHDLALSKDMVDQLAIMYVGQIVESGPPEAVVANPYHPYTHALTAAVPVPDPTAPKIRVLAKGEIPTNISPPPGCRFHPRCPFAQGICAEKEPPLIEASPGRQVACHFWKEANAAFMKGLDRPEGAVANA
ncbi:MAG TPA: ABC transporter ATP-binding protein [Nitrososphaerales archaeon]|nr:ABC transporter ATP-binding protein [Nitrososphaerales archaeon]